MIRVTAAASETILSAANQYAMCIGLSEAEEDTYVGLNWQDAQGNRYAATSFMVRPEWLMAAQSPLVRPAWDTGNVIDMALAAQGQAALRFWMAGVNAPPAPLAAAGLLTVYAGMGIQEALEAMGLSPVVIQDGA